MSKNISDAAKFLAEKHKIDLSTVKGSGPGGRITKADIDKVLAAPKTPKATESK